MSDQRMVHEPWPLRAAILLVAGAICGLVFDRLIRGEGDYWSVTEDMLRLSLATFVATGGILVAFTLERARWRWSLAFGLGAGAVLGGIFYWNGSPQSRGADDVWRVLAALLAVAIAAPLFQTMRDEGTRRLPYPPVHAHVWANVVLWFAAWAFVLITYLLAQLLAELFQLIGIDLLRTLLGKAWFNWMLVGGTLGAAIGLLRDRDRVVGVLQRVVTTILAVLAPVLAAGLVLFVLALPFTGLDILWDQTRATTPIVLSCVIGAFILANAVIGSAPDEEAKNPVLRWSAMALGAVMLPLVAVAAVSTGLRIGQHGFTPSRLWAVVFVAIAAAYALFYLYALIRGRARWADFVRPANIRLAVAVCLVALLLATPLANFGAISTGSQLARLESGEVPPAEFDWQALRFDFGPSGVAALRRLEARGTPEARRLAAEALRAARRWELADMEERRFRRARPLNLALLPAGTAMPEGLPDETALHRTCSRQGYCVLIREPGSARAVLVSARVCTPRNPEAARLRLCDPAVTAYYLDAGEWRTAPPVAMGSEEVVARHRRLEAALRQGRVEIRDVPRRQVFVDGVPVGDAFE